MLTPTYGPVLPHPSARTGPLTRTARFALSALLASALALAGCNGGGTAPAVAEGTAQASSLFSACTTKGNEGDAKATLGKFMVTTNVWNPNATGSFTECVKAKVNNSTGAVDATINWNVAAGTNQVLSYPNLSYGWQVGTDQGSTTRKLPATISSLGDLKASGRIESICAPGATCTHNTAFELLFTNSATPTTWPPTAEVMVWVQATCNSCNAGKLEGKVNIDGVNFEVYKGMVTPPTGTASWTYVAYVAETTTTQFNFNFKNFLDDSVKRGYLNTSDYLAVVEVGTEITSGQGTTTLSGYNIQ